MVTTRAKGHVFTTVPFTGADGQLKDNTQYYRLDVEF